MRQRSLLASLCLVAIAAASCGGSVAPATGGGSATVTGTIAGAAVPANGAMATAFTTTSNGVTATSRTVSITSLASTCGCQVTPTTRYTALVLSVGAEGAAVAAGVYPGTGAWYYVQNGAGAHPPSDLVAAAGGSITISEASASTTAGTFDLTFTSGDHVTGSFSAPTCASGEVPASDACR